MKRILFFTLFIASIATFSACNNGAYDAQPDKDNSAVPNWLDPKYAHTTGEMKFTKDGETKQYWGTYVKYNDDKSIMFGGILEDGVKRRSLEFNLPDYKGATTYNFNKDNANSAIFSLEDMATNNLEEEYKVEFMSPGTGKLEIVAETDNTLYGTFELTLTKSYPNVDDNDKMSITVGSFILKKQ